MEGSLNWKPKKFLDCKTLKQKTNGEFDFDTIEKCFLFQFKENLLKRLISLKKTPNNEKAEI